MSHVLVTGGGGRLAKAVMRSDTARVRLMDRAELDITDARGIAATLAASPPAAVINAAAVSDIEASERDPARAFAVNAVAPGLLAAACRDACIPFIQVSTDYVFGAPTVRPWREEDPVSPINAYGRSKAEGERQALAAGGQVCVVRVAWLFGDRRDFICRLLEQAGPVEIADDQIGSPTPIGPLAERLLLLAGEMMRGAGVDGDILHLAGEPATSRADWVTLAFEGLRRKHVRAPELIRRPMSHFPSQTPRPLFSALDCSRAARRFGSPLNWRKAALDAATFVDLPS